MMKVALVANGEIKDYAFLKRALTGYNLIIAVDGGMRHLEKIDTKPDYWVGDMDSYKSKCRWQNEVIIRKYLPEKDFSDLELAVMIAKELKAEQLDFYAVLGNRIDHTLINIALLKSVKVLNMSGVIVSATERLYLANQHQFFDGVLNKTFSIVPISDLEDVTITGAKYPLNNAEVAYGSTLCLSNIATKDCVGITILRGEAYIVVNEERV